MEEAWQALQGAGGTKTLKQLFASEPDRLDRLVLEACGIRFDFAKTHLESALIGRFSALAEAQDLAGHR